jgi:3-methyladenine DNA glycosylase/8-oxoguanine DNA glycosylase
MPTEITIQTPPNFSFKRTIISHGWCELLPFSIDREKWALRRIIDLGARPPVAISLTGQKRTVKIISARRLAKADEAKVVRDARHILRLDDDLAAFYSAMSAEPDFGWIAEQGAGRMLRSPTVFEDLVKMICTTNCSWALTEKMTSGLVQNLGRPTSDDQRTFPTPQAMALMPTLHSPLSTKELIKAMKCVKGVGDYAAENLLKLVGRYDGLALDSWTRAKFYKVRNNGRKATDKKIARYYSKFNEWRGLALWCDMTRDWME